MKGQLHAEEKEVLLVVVDIVTGPGYSVDSREGFW
jgi:hypothetical protein